MSSSTSNFSNQNIKTEALRKSNVPSAIVGRGVLPMSELAIVITPLGKILCITVISLWRISGRILSSFRILSILIRLNIPSLSPFIWNTWSLQNRLDRWSRKIRHSLILIILIFIILCHSPRRPRLRAISYRLIWVLDWILSSFPVGLVAVVVGEIGLHVAHAGVACRYWSASWSVSFIWKLLDSPCGKFGL